MMFWITLSSALLPASANATDFYLGSWSYTQSAGDDPRAMWTVHDFIRNTTHTNTGAVNSIDSGATNHAALVPWQNIIFARGEPTTYAKLSNEILRRTGVNVPVMWTWDAWATCNGNVSAIRASWHVFTALYANLQGSSYGAHLPATPFGVSLGDEPGLRNNITGNATTSALAAALSIVKTTYPDATTHINLLYGTLACDSGTDTLSYCCCSVEREGFSTATGMAQRLGHMQLDWVSSDEYYDVSMADYRKTYESKLYPHLRPEQRVVLTPFAAYCELGCAPSTRIAPEPADGRVLAQAQAHADWAASDPRVVGMFIYRLKNIWQRSADTDACMNPWQTGLGLVDRCGNASGGGFATPRSVQFYQELLPTMTALRKAKAEKAK